MILAHPLIYHSSTPNRGARTRVGRTGARRLGSKLAVAAAVAPFSSLPGCVQASSAYRLAAGLQLVKPLPSASALMPKTLPDWRQPQLS